MTEMADNIVTVGHLRTGYQVVHRTIKYDRDEFGTINMSLTRARWDTSNKLSIVQKLYPRVCKYRSIVLIY